MPRGEADPPPGPKAYKSLIKVSAYFVFLIAAWNICEGLLPVRRWWISGSPETERLKGPAWSWWCLSFALQRYTRCSEAESLVGAGEVQCINNTSRMTNRLFLLSDYCFGLSYLWILQWLSSLTAGVSDVVEGIGSSVHLEIFFSQSCPECWDDAFIFTWQSCLICLLPLCVLI